MVANASELADSTRVVPDFNTWVQCFAIYAAVLIAKSPERAPFLLSYTSLLAQFSKRYRFPSWLLYDRKFCGEAAESGRPIGRRWMVLSGVRAQDPPSMGSKRLFPASSKRSLKRRGWVFGLRTPPLNGFEASLPGLQQAITQEEAPSGRRSWSLVGGRIGRGSLTARLGSIASTCMFVQLAKGITQS